jgi:hypothetical protein
VKKGEQAELSSKWWRASQPKGLASAGKFETALKHYEAARAKLEHDGTKDVLDAAMAALDDVAATAEAVATEAGRAKGSPEMEATARALDRLNLRKERAWAAAQVSEDDDERDEDDPNGIADPNAYQDYLLKALKKLKNGPMNFGLVLGGKSTEHRIVLHRKRAAKTLAMRTVKELGLRHFTFGVAHASEERPQTIVLDIEGHLLPGIRKKGERMLKDYKPLPFMRIALFVDDAEVDDPVDPDDAEPDDADSDEADSDEADGDGVKANDAGSKEAKAGAGDSATEKRAGQQAEAEEDAALAEAAASTLAPVRLKQEMEAIDPVLRAVLRRHVELREPLMASVAAFVAALNTGDVGSAQRQMGRIKAMMSAHGVE